MAANANLVKVEVIDQNGKLCDASFWVPGSVTDPADAGILDIIGKLVLLIEGGTVEYELIIQDPVAVPGTGVAGGYNAADKILVEARSTADASIVTIEIPDPGVTDGSAVPLFLPSGVVNTASTAISDMISFVNANAKDTNGEPVVFVSARRSRAAGLKTKFG
jgi:hypothetical protein